MRLVFSSSKAVAFSSALAKSKKKLISFENERLIKICQWQPLGAMHSDALRSSKRVHRNELRRGETTDVAPKLNLLRSI